MPKKSADTTSDLSSSASPKRQKVDKEQDLRTVGDVVDDSIKNETITILYLEPILRGYEMYMTVNKQLIPWDDIRLEIGSLLKDMFHWHFQFRNDLIISKKWEYLVSGLMVPRSTMAEHPYKRFISIVPKAPMLLKADECSTKIFGKTGKTRPQIVPLMNLLQTQMKNCLNGCKELQKLRPWAEMDRAVEYWSELYETLQEIPDINYISGYPAKKLKEAGRLIMHVPCTVDKHYVGTARGKPETKDLFVFENILLFCKYEEDFLFKYLSSVKLDKKKQKLTKEVFKPRQIYLTDVTYRYVITVQTPTLRDAVFQTLNKSKQ